MIKSMWRDVPRRNALGEIMQQGVEEPGPKRVAHSPMFPVDDPQPRLQAEFAEFLRGKSVAIVGKGVREDEPENPEWGKRIDSYDVVVRVHWPIPYHGDILPGHTSEQKSEIKWDPPPFVPKKWQPIVGSKTHIFYTTIVDAGRGWCKSIIQAFRDEGGLFICEMHPSIISHLPSGMLKEHTEVRQVSVYVHHRLYDLLGSQPFGGTMAVVDILRHAVREVYITRMPCFFSNSHLDGFRGPNPQAIPPNDLRFLKGLWEDNRDRITVDPFMEYVFDKFGNKTTVTTQDFPEFEAGSRHDTPEFTQYRRDMGFEPLKLKEPDRTKAIVKEIRETAQQISHSNPSPVLHGETELRDLYEVALGLHDTADVTGHVIQCGTYRGGSAAVLAMALKNRHATLPVITIDNFNYARNNDETSETTDDVFLAHKRLLDTLELQKYINSVWGDDVEFLSKSWNMPIRMAVIDSSHSYEHTWKEINAISPHIVPGGWMVFHDYRPQSMGVPHSIHEWLPTLDRRYKLFESPVYAFIQLL